MTKQAKDDWQKRQDLDNHGFDIHIDPAIHLHNRNESAKHAYCKLALCREIQNRGRRYDTEVSCGSGRVDVMDFGKPEEQIVIYELESNASPQQRKEKAEQYAGGPIRDVIVVDPQQAPDTIEAIEKWAEAVITG